MKNYTLGIIRFVSLLILVSVQFSCSDYYEELFERKQKKAKVETLVTNFGANDGLSVNSNGTIFASNFNNFSGTEVLKVNPRTGAVEVAVDSLVAPTGNVVDRNGNLYIVNNVRIIDANTNEIAGDVLKLDSEGNRTLLATLPGFPSGITISSSGNLFVSNFSFPGVHRITPQGEVSIYAQDDRLQGGVGIDFDNRGNIFVGNFSTGDILKINKEGTTELLTTIPTVQEGFVIGYLTFYAGKLFVTGIGEHVIYSVSMDGQARIIAGTGIQQSVDGNFKEASFDSPNGIAADPKRRVLYVSEGGNGALRVLKFK